MTGKKIRSTISAMSSPDYIQIAEVAVVSAASLALLFFAIRSIVNNLGLLSSNKSKNDNNHSSSMPSATMGAPQIANHDQRSHTLIPLSNRGMVRSKKNSRKAIKVK